MITAYQFAQQPRPSATSYFGFGIDNKKTAQALRQLAADVEAGRVLLQRVQTVQEATQEDYTVSSLHISYSEPQLTQADCAEAGL